MLLKKIFLAAAFFIAALHANAGIFIWDSKLYVADTGQVSATFLGSDASYTDILFFSNTGAKLFNNHKTALNTTINLGMFDAGTELLFRLYVKNTHKNFFTGPASNNFDGVIHATAWLDADQSAVVGFEDLVGGGDHDYNDLRFRVTNVSDIQISPVPEPSSYAMILGGLGLIGFLSRRRKNNQVWK